MDISESGTKRNCKADTKAMEELAKILFKTEWIDRYSEDLDEMNSGKVGHPFVFTNAMISWIFMIKCTLGLSFRFALGIVNLKLDEKGMRNISLSQFYERSVSMRKYESCETDERILAFGCAQPKEGDGKLEIAVDSTGISKNKKGSWLTTIYKIRKKGWIKLHAAVNTETNEILAYAITTEKCGDNTCFELLIDKLLDSGFEIRKILADAAYDSKDNWNKYGNKGIEVCINIKSRQIEEDRWKKKPSVRSGGSMRRAQEIRKINKIGRKEWKIQKGYGRRWKVECTFSDFKRIFIDTVSAMDDNRAVGEVIEIIEAHNLYKSLRQQYLEV